MSRIQQVIDELKTFEDKTTFRQGIDPDLFKQFEEEHGFSLPEAHQEVLLQSNGMESYGGYIRLFGLYSEECIDAVTWNQFDCWKFAWNGTPDFCNPNYFWCFGSSAPGEQYAYKLDELKSSTNPKIYLLYAFDMLSEQIESCFKDFFETEYLRCANKHYGFVPEEGRPRCGDLKSGQEIDYIPPFFLQHKSPDPDTLEVVDARAAMICGGDVARQWDIIPEEAEVTKVESYEDEKGRPRIKLIWNNN